VAGEPDSGLETEDLPALIREIRERVRARYPDAAEEITLADVMPILRARDAAQAKLAGIGTVNPRPPGLLNSAVQAVKRTVARALDWHIRDQREFNQAAVSAIEAIVEALNENNRALKELAERNAQMGERVQEARRETADARANFIEWRVAWEQRLAATENELLRTIAELKGAFDFRVTRISEGIQRRLWADLERVRGEYEALIHTELRLVRQRAALSSVAVPPPAVGTPAALPAPDIDYGRFAERFRGTEEYVRERQRFYVPFFEQCREVLDLGCGRGEFLEVMAEACVPARGIELNEELVALCLSKGLSVERADLLTHLPSLPEESLGGIFSAHVVEHLPPERLPEVIRAAASRLRRGGILAIETPNPECLAIFATHFYLDPTHVRPIPPGLLTFYCEEAGFGRIEIHRLSPAVDAAPSLASLAEDFRNAFFGGLDYALTARKL
jgi:2-polyprenyl-3-methyl-5-hydroxy-6-metoxy-1,4-benzoquinol methylase